MSKPKLPWVRMVCYLPFAMAGTAIGLLALMPPLTPLGFLILFIINYPYAKWLGKKINQDFEYQERDHSLNEGEELPWEQESELTEDDMINIILNNNGRGANNG